MAERSATAEWKGGLKDGNGKMSLGSGAFEGSFSFGTRMEDEKGTNPEELIGAALAGCFSMALAATLGKEGLTVKEIDTSTKVEFGKEGDGFAIKFINLETKADVDGIDEAKFQEIAEKVKETCPVAKALAVQINLKANLV
ncbi:MAG: OsmC family peroxiredoxin [Acidobacteriota bacterium]|nr:OsmC family peroxiredoxin [Acidobacteriota bacterium]